MVVNRRFFFIPVAMSPLALVTTDLRDKFRGAMIGAVLGDALGAPLEFKWAIQYHGKCSGQFLNYCQAILWVMLAKRFLANFFFG